MNFTSELDFSLDRALRLRRRQAVLVALCLTLGLQLGVTAWRMQALKGTRTALQAQRQQLIGKSELNGGTPLTSAQLKVVTSAQTMLDSMAVPWEAVLTAVEAARIPQILVDSITPHATDGGITVSITSRDFEGVATFVQAMQRQDALHGVVLVSEALSNNGGASMHAVIYAKWR